MKKLCIIFRQGPHGTTVGREALDLAMLSASFEQEVSLIFTDEGVLHLIQNQQAEQIGCKDYIATFGALALYDIETVLVCQDSLNEFGLTTQESTQENPAEFAFEATPTSAAEISSHLATVDEVLVF